MIKKPTNYNIPNSLIGIDSTTRAKAMQKEMEKAAEEFAKIYDLYQLELKDDELEGVNEDFEKWCNSTEDIEKYKNVEIINPDKVIVKLYRFIKPYDGNLYGVKEKHRIFPYAKILRVSDIPGQHNLNVKPGDIFYCPMAITKTETNPYWAAWKQKQETERPKPEEPEPAKTLGLLKNWQDESMFVLDPFNITVEDEYTFLRSIYSFNAFYKRK